jgi:hypothetical protein
MPAPTNPNAAPLVRPPAPRAGSGRAQLSLVEHALCPLDATTTLAGPFIHETGYAYTDEQRHRQRATVRVCCPEGLSPTDEFYLWGLLSLTFAQPNPTLDFYATPYFCMRRLRCIDQGSHRGGKNFALFRGAIARLAAVSYRNDRFYDPIRGEHRAVSFGFFSYSLPLSPDSARTWRFAWDPIFFEFCQAARGTLLFDFDTYRALDPASRRLYLLLKKMFWRSDTSPEFEVRDLAVNTVGFAASHETWRLKQKLAVTTAVLLHHGIVRLPEGASDPRHLFLKRGKSHYTLRFWRGPHFDRADAAQPTALTDSPLHDPLRSIGLDPTTIARVLAQYAPRLVAECADITLAAQERFGASFFRVSPQAHFMDNLKEFAAGRRTPPDWWREIRRQEEIKRRNTSTTAEPDETHDREFEEYLKTEAHDAFDNVMRRVFNDFRRAGQSEPEAREHAEHIARTHFLHRFRASTRPSSSHS